MGTNTIAKRVEFIDVIKAIAIILVVIGHALNEDVFSLGRFSFVLRMIYIFHLPVFFFCTGYLFKDQKITRRFLSIFKHQYIPTTLFTLDHFYCFQS